MRAGKRRALDKTKPINQLVEELERLKASIRDQGRAWVSGDQAPVRACEGAPPGAEQEHRAVVNAVRAVESADGAQNSAGTGWANPCATGRSGLKGRKKWPPTRQNRNATRRFGARNHRIAITTLLDAHFPATCADLP